MRMQPALPAVRPASVWRRARALLGSPVTAAVVLALVLAGLFLVAQAEGVTGTRLLSLVVRGVLLAGILALGAIGLSLVYGVMRFGNFAHGDIMSLGAYVVLALLPLFPTSPPLIPFSFGWEFVILLPVGIVATGLAAVAVDRVVFRPLRTRRASLVILTMAALGSAFFVRSAIYLAWGADFRFFYTGRARPAVEIFEGVLIRADQLIILGLSIALIMAVYFLLERTRMGKAMRAVADNPELARISGIATERVILWTWMIGGGLAGAAGIMLGLDSQLRPEMGWFLLLPLFAAVILGSIGNPYGALVGALVIGIVTQVSTAFINPAYAPGAAFVILILMLLVRPQGLFGGRGA